MSTLRRPRGQSLVEFAVTLPAALLLVLLIVRMMIILNVWYTITQTTNIAIRAAALTGEASQACRLVMENLRNYAPDHLTVTISFADKKAVCQFVVVQSPLNIDPEIFITVTPDLPKFQPPITPSATPYTPTPGQTLIPTNTANPAGGRYDTAPRPASTHPDRIRHAGGGSLRAGLESASRGGGTRPAGKPREGPPDRDPGDFLGCCGAGGGVGKRGAGRRSSNSRWS